MLKLYYLPFQHFLSHSPLFKQLVVTESTPATSSDHNQQVCDIVYTVCSSFKTYFEVYFLTMSAMKDRKVHLRYQGGVRCKY
jgi:hypothetical protein